MNCKKSIVFLVLALGGATGSAVHAHGCSDLADTAVFSLDQYLDISFHSGDERKIRGKQALHARVFADDGKRGLKSLPLQTPSDPLYPLKDFSVVGKWWNALGELVANPGLVWRYKDHFTVVDKDGAKYEIDRKMLAKYPDLQRRLMAARPMFDRIEIGVYGAHDVRKSHSAYDPRITFFIDANDVVVPPEGLEPYMIPMSPPNWEDRLRIGDLSGANLVKAWAQLKGVRCPQVTIHNLRLPTDALVDIAKEAQRYRGIDAVGEKYRKLSEPGYKLPPADKPYSGPKRNLEPLVAPTQFAEVERDGKQLVLKEKRKGSSEASGKVLFSTSAYVHAYYIDKDGRYFLFQKSSGEASILNARGQKVAVGGVDTFAGAWWEGEEQLYLMPEGHSSSNHVYMTKYFFQYSMAPATMTPQEFENFKTRDRELQPCPYRARSGGVALSSPWYRWDYHRTRLIIVNRTLKPLFDGDRIVRGESYPARAGNRVCQ